MLLKQSFCAIALGVAGTALASGDWPEPYPVAATLAPESLPRVPARQSFSVCEVPPPQHHFSRRQRWRQDCREALADQGIRID